MSREEEEDFPGASAVEKCVYKIPICGGFCAPTKNPSSSFMRHFSNEWTPPQPCLRSRCFRGWLEHSCFARWFGSVGLESFGDKHRKVILTFSFFVSLVAWCFLIFASCAITSKRSVLSNTHWVKASIDRGSARAFIGLSHVGVDFKKTVGTSLPSYRMSGLHDSCDNGLPFVSKSNDDREVIIEDFGQIFDNDKCSTCRKAAESSVSLAISSAVTQVFQMTTALQRTTPYGDLNCQKIFGVFTGIYSLFSTVQSLRSFRSGCGLQTDLPPWRHTRKIDAFFVDTGEAVRIRVRLNAGLAFSLLAIAIWLKVIDICCHLIVPTPKQKQRKLNPDEPANSHFESYLLTATAPLDDDKQTEMI